MTTAAEVQAEILRLYVKEQLGIKQLARRLKLSTTRITACLDAAGVKRAAPVEQLPALSAAARERLPYAMSLVCETLRRLQPPPLPDTDADDWLSVARLAACKALATYDPAHGASWQAWVISKVRWAIADELRRVAHVSREHLREARAEQEDRAAAKGIPVEAEPLCLPRVISIDALSCENAETALEDWESDRWEPGIPCQAQSRLIEQEIRRAVRALPERQRFVVQERMRERPFEEIARSLGCGREWAERLQRQAWATLRERLRWAEPGKEGDERAEPGGHSGSGGGDPDPPPAAARGNPAAPRRGD